MLLMSFSAIKVGTIATKPSASARKFIAYVMHCDIIRDADKSNYTNIFCGLNCYFEFIQQTYAHSMMIVLNMSVDSTIFTARRLDSINVTNL